MRVAIIGNGAAGNYAAETIKQHRPETEVIMLSREPYPLYSPCALPDCLAGNIERSRLFLKSVNKYQDDGVQTAFGQAVERIDIKERAIITDQSVYDYDRLIIATGSRAVIPSLPGASLRGAFTLKTLDDLDSLLCYQPKRVVVVGSGNIGMEAAQAMRERHCEVSIIEARDSVMPRLFDTKPGGLLRQMLQKTGIEVLVSEQVRAIVGSGQVEAVNTDQREIGCDMLIWAVGLLPECSLASAAGIELGETGGIKVDRYMRCSEAVYACGDCAETYDIVSGHPVTSMLWPTARRQGQVAALNCLDIETEYEGAFSVVVGEIDERPFAALGLKEDSQHSSIRVIEGEYEGSYWRLLLDDQSLIGMQAIGDLKFCGTIGGLIKNRTQQKDVWGILQNPYLKMTTPWLAEAAGRYMVNS